MRWQANLLVRWTASLEFNIYVISIYLIKFPFTFTSLEIEMPIVQTKLCLSLYKINTFKLTYFMIWHDSEGFNFHTHGRKLVSLSGMSKLFHKGPCGCKVFFPHGPLGNSLDISGFHGISWINNYHYPSECGHHVFQRPLVVKVVLFIVIFLSLPLRIVLLTFPHRHKQNLLDGGNKGISLVLNGHTSSCSFGLDVDDFVYVGWGMRRDVRGSDPLPSGHH